MKIKKAQAMGINWVIWAILALIVIVLAIWLGSKTLGMGKFVSDALI